MKTVLVIGLGKFGRHMAKKLIDEGNDVMGVDLQEEVAERATPFMRDIQIGDATDEAFISTLGVNMFDFCVVATGGNFQTALEITVLLKDYGAKFIIARANREVHRKLLLRNGADHVVYAEKEIAERLAIKYGAKNIFDYIELTEDVGIYEIAVPPSWYGKSIIEKSVRAKYHISILATKKNGEIFPLPPSDYRFRPDETLMVMATEAALKALVK